MSRGGWDRELKNLHNFNNFNNLHSLNNLNPGEGVPGGGGGVGGSGAPGIKDLNNVNPAISSIFKLCKLFNSRGLGPPPPGPLPHDLNFVNYCLYAGGRTRLFCLTVGGAPPSLLERILSSISSNRISFPHQERKAASCCQLRGKRSSHLSREVVRACLLC